MRVLVGGQCAGSWGDPEVFGDRCALVSLLHSVVVDVGFFFSLLAQESEIPSSVITINFVS